jgi:hypothetical protein
LYWCFVKVAEICWMYWPENFWGPGNTGEDLEEGSNHRYICIGSLDRR